MRADIVAGALFPDYELTERAGKRRKLSDLQGPDPMILVLSRGGYCPKDLRQAEGLVQLHHEMEVGYSRLVTISTDNMLTTNEYRTGVGAHWTFLSDPGRKVQQDLDIAEYTDPEHNPMIPHVIVLEPGLIIFKIYNGYWFLGRPTIEELRQDLRAGVSGARVSIALGSGPRTCSETRGRIRETMVQTHAETSRDQFPPWSFSETRLSVGFERVTG